MALEDVCNYGDTPGRHKWFSASPFEDTASSLCLTHYYNFGLKTNCQVPLNLFSPALADFIPSNHRHSFLFSQANHSATVDRPFPVTHGTTTLGFVFQGGVIAAADTRASAGGFVACPAVHKITPIHSHLVVTSSGSGADCMLWERILAREIRLYQLRHRRRLPINGAAKLLSFMLHPFKGTNVCVALTLCGWDNEAGSIECMKTSEDSSLSSSAPVSMDNATATACSASANRGPKLIYVCSDGARLQGDLFSVGSGSPYAYGILDRELRWNMSKDEAISLAREAVFRATHRDAYSGNNVDIFHITDQGWIQRQRENLKEEYYQEMERKKKQATKYK